MISLDMFRRSQDVHGIDAGHVIFDAGDPGDHMYVVLEGRVTLSLKGRELESVGPGGAFGEMALIDAAPRTARATAATDCRVVAIDAQRFQFLVRETPVFALQIMQLMAERLRRMDTLLAAS